ncbi:MAG: oxidase [Gammaproteobacteria bacterium]|nr:MAG: oxidase [Gammaproteobacteria bacterium]
MATRRELLLAATGGWLIGRVRASDGAGTVVEVEPLAALPGKKPLIRRSFRPPNFETPLADLAAPLTDDGAFFVRYHLTVIPRIDPDGWRLQVSGASARRALTLSLAELRSGFEQVEVVAVNQCAGNRRGLFTPRVPGVQWGGGAMGNARWRGVRLREVLQRAGVAADALEVVFGGADAPVLPATPAFVKSLPVERALDESTLVAFEMNGRPLPHWNGAPARLVVPGWVGTYWMKHLTSIRIEPRAFDGFCSLIVSPVSGARLSRGAHAELAGKAWDGGAGIEGVEVSVDGGQSWRDATLQRDLGRFAWREFRFVLDTSRAVRLDVAVRARSRNGAKQPDRLTPNPSGYHDNIVQAVSLEIA